MSPARRRARRFNPDRDVKDWKGAYVPYDILKEAFVAFLAVAVLIVLLAVVFSSPDDTAVTLKRWSIANPVDFAQTAITELDGTSATASYGPPYNSTADAAQHIGFFEPAQWFGVHQPIDTAHDFVLYPLSTLVNQPAVQAALKLYEGAPAAQQNAWTTAYEKAVANATDGARASPCAGRALRACRRDDRHADGHVADRWPRWHPLERGAGSTTPTTPSRCSSSRTARTWPTWPKRSTSKAPSGA